MVALKLHRSKRVKFIRSRRFFENLVDSRFKIGIVGFEEIFEQKCQKLARPVILSVTSYEIAKDAV